MLVHFVRSGRSTSTTHTQSQEPSIKQIGHYSFKFDVHDLTVRQKLDKIGIYGRSAGHKSFAQKEHKYFMFSRKAF